MASKCNPSLAVQTAEEKCKVQPSALRETNTLKHQAIRAAPSEAPLLFMQLG